jgi:hypothetical protein
MWFSSRHTKRLLVIRVVVASLALAAAASFATLSAPSALACDTYVSGYYRSDGTYVPGHYRSCANNTTWDNWTTKGNTNPYTSEPGYRSPYSPSISSPSRCYFSWSC